MAAAALFISLGGTSYAVATLPKNSVGSAQVKNGSLTAKDLARGVLTSGPQGPAGARGPRGAEGAPGPVGPAGPGERTALVGALPLAPADGQEVYFQSAEMAGSGVVWHLRFRAAAPGPYKWEFVGGAGLYATAGMTATSATTYLTSAASPSITVPLAGEYDAEMSARLYNSGNGVGVAAVVALGDANGEFPNARIDSYQGAQGTSITLFAASNARVVRFTRGTPGVVQARLFAYGGEVTSDHRDLRITPVRVG